MQPDGERAGGAAPGAGCACCGDSGHTTATTHDNYLPPRAVPALVVREGG